MNTSSSSNIHPSHVHTQTKWMKGFPISLSFRSQPSHYFLFNLVVPVSIKEKNNLSSVKISMNFSHPTVQNKQLLSPDILENYTSNLMKNVEILWKKCKQNIWVHVTRPLRYKHSATLNTYYLNTITMFSCVLCIWQHNYIPVMSIFPSKQYILTTNLRLLT